MDGNQEHNDPPEERPESRPENNSGYVTEEVLSKMIQNLRVELEPFKTEILKLKEKVMSLENQISQKDEELKKKQDEIEDLRAQLLNLKEETKLSDERKDGLIWEKVKEIEELRKEVDRLKIELNNNKAFEKKVKEFRAAFAAYIFEVIRSYDSLGIPQDRTIEQLRSEMTERDGNYVTNIQHLDYLVNNIPCCYENFTGSIIRVAKIWKDLHNQGKLDRGKWRRKN
jgi:DNA repair exonuclease SbcCD ATPase subunit